MISGLSLDFRDRFLDGSGFVLDVDITNMLWRLIIFLFQAEDGIRDLVRSRGLGDVYKRQG